MPVPITASILYDLIHCPHRVTIDLFGDPVRKDLVNPFVQLLWERGNLYEKEVVSKLYVPFLDLSTFRGDEKETLTREAIHLRK